MAYEDQHATIPRGDLQFAALSSLGLVLFAAAVALVLPSPHALSTGGFVLIAKGFVAEAATLLHGLAIPLAIVGSLGLALDAVIAMRPRLPISWHYACAVQPVVVIATGALAACLVLGLLVSLVIWLLLAAFILLGIGMLLGG